MWGSFTFPPINLWSVWPTKEQVDIHEKYTEKMEDELTPRYFKGFTNRSDDE